MTSHPPRHSVVPRFAWTSDALSWFILRLLTALAVLLLSLTLRRLIIGMDHPFSPGALLAPLVPFGKIVELSTARGTIARPRRAWLALGLVATVAAALLLGCSVPLAAVLGTLWTLMSASVLRALRILPATTEAAAIAAHRASRLRGQGTRR